ncbi:hypothetical protein [Brevibacillus borstelensis]|uniref:hypothetical protein n=1 Tax=Brevibacillus borstelensis TaxID=45462 RepID=UPI0003A3C36B|nr:hypothetical protein [Brevibacillus borstelensis]
MYEKVLTTLIGVLVLAAIAGILALVGGLFVSFLGPLVGIPVAIAFLAGSYYVGKYV